MADLIGRLGAPRVVVDFEAVNYMSSRVFGLMLGIHRRIAQKQGRLCLCSLKPHLLDMFAMMRLDQIFDIQPDLPQALASVAKGE